MYLHDIQEKIKNILKKEYNISVFLKNNSQNIENFDLCLPLFLYQKIFNIDLLEIFSKFKKKIIILEEIENIFFKNGFLNIQLNKNFLSQKILKNIITKKNNYGQKKKKNKVIVLDYSSPNIAKNFSIGHLRSTVIGNAMKNIYKKLGFRTVSINHLGDWGTQFGKLILAYKKWGSKDIILKKPIDELQKLYIMFHKEAAKNEELNREAKFIFNQLENNNKDILCLWRWFKNISLKEFKKIYNLLNVVFDFYIGESFFHKKSLKLLKQLMKKKLLFLDQKAYIIPLDKHIPPALLQKDNGSTLYLTRDLACVLYRYKKFNFHKCLYIVGNEQKLHYQQLTQLVNKIGYPELKIEHINFGLVLAQNEKISTRKNYNYKFLDILQKITDETVNLMKNKNNNSNELELKQKAQKIAIGAIVFNDLKNDRHLDIEFDLKKMLQFEGNTGPYLQYTIVRLNSVISKYNDKKKLYEYNWPKMNVYYQKNHYFILIKMMDQFTVILEKSQNKNMPSILARYLFLLAQNTNKFYTQEKILVMNDSVLQEANIFIMKAVSIVLKEGLRILGIPILEKM